MTVDLKPQYLRVTNYERYQHYKDRRPVWVKFYIELLDDYDLNRQKPAARLLALMLLLVAATHDNRIPYDPEWIAGKVHMRVASVSESLEVLVTIGFLTLASRKHSASKTLAKSSGLAMPETEREKRQREKKNKQKQDPIQAVVVDVADTASVFRIPKGKEAA